MVSELVEVEVEGFASGTSSSTSSQRMIVLERFPCAGGCVVCVGSFVLPCFFCESKSTLLLPDLVGGDCMESFTKRRSIRRDENQQILVQVRSAIVSVSMALIVGARLRYGNKGSATSLLPWSSVSSLGCEHFSADVGRGLRIYVKLKSTHNTRE
jgi:uncharacterized membrane protein